MIAPHKCFLTTYSLIAPFVEVDCEFARNKKKFVVICKDRQNKYALLVPSGLLAAG
jgi:hypothetical protein